MLVVDDVARYGRRKDQLAAVVDATQARIESLQMLQTLNRLLDEQPVSGSL